MCSWNVNKSTCKSNERSGCSKRNRINIEAHPVGSIDQFGDAADVILLGPQVRYELKNVKAKYPNKPVEVINMQDYGMMNGNKVLDTALKLIEG